MLNALRKAAGSWVAKLLFVLLIISFAAWGVGDFLRPSADAAVAQVGDSEISPEEYRREFLRQLDRLRQRFGPSLTQEMALQLGLGSQVLSQLIERRLLGLEAHELGVRIGDDTVRRRIFTAEAFQDPTGQFDRSRFEQALRINNLTEEGFVSILRGDLIRSQVTDALTAGVVAPESLAESLYRYRQEQRVAEILFLPNTAAGTPPAPTDADIAAYYDANKDRYIAPEYRGITAVLLRPEDLAAEMQVPDERMREAYENRLAEFRTPETRNVSQLLFADEAAARAAYERLAGGAAFDTVAAESKDAQRTDLGAVKRGDLFPENVETAAFALPGPGFTEPVQSPLGWHILNVSAVTPGTTRPFEEVRDRIRHEIAQEMAVDALFDMSNRLQDALAGGATLEEAAETLNLKLVKIPAVDQGGLDEAGRQAEGLPRIPSFLPTAFGTAQGEVSQLIDTPDGGAFILRVDNIKPSQQRPLEAVRDQVAAAWRAEQERKQALAEAEKLAERVRAGETLAAVAQERGLTTRMLPPFGRQMDAPADHMPAALVEKLFAAAPGDVAVGQLPDGAIMARLVEIKPAQPDADRERIAALRDDLAQRMTNDLQAQYATALQNRYGVTVDQEALQRLF